MKARGKRLIAMLLVLCTMLSAAPLVFAEESTASTEESRVVTYDFDLGATRPDFANKAFTNQHVPTGKSILEVVTEYYTGGTLNWKPESWSTGLVSMFRVAPQGLRVVPSASGQWLALRIKSPGAGTYDLSLKRGLSYSSDGSVYILDGSTTDIPAAIAAGKALAEVAYLYEDNATVSLGEYTFGDAEEYIVVFTGSGRFYLSALTMTEVIETEPENKALVYDFDLADLETGIYSTPESSSYVDLKDNQEDLSARYTEGSLNWNYEAICNNMCTDGTLSAGAVRLFGETGMRLYCNKGYWVAFRIKSPGEGIHTLTLNHATMADGARATVYILPADTEDIEKAIDPTNRVGKVNFHNADGARAYVDGSTTVLGSYRFGAAEEYILVIEATESSPFHSTRAYLMFSQLIVTEGYTDKPVDDSEKKPGSIIISDEVVCSSDGTGAAMSAEINGVDYYFAPMKGGRMFVYNLSTMEMVQEVKLNMNSPGAMNIDQNGDIWICGTGGFLHIYDPVTGEISRTGSYSTGALAGNSGSTGITFDENGCAFFGTNKPAHVVKYNPATREFTDLGCVDTRANSINGVAYKDGFIYAAANGKDFHIVVKINAATGEIVDSIDTAKKMGAVVTSHTLRFLDANTFVVSGNRLENMIAIDISGEKMAFKDIGIDTGINNHPSEVRDGKIYFVCYNRGLCEYDIATGKAKQIEGFEATGIGFCFGNNNWVSVDHPDLPGESLMTATSSNCAPVLYNLQTKKTVRLDELVAGYGAGQVIRGFVSTTDGSSKIYIGGYNTPNAIIFDVETGTIAKRYLSSGQTDAQIIYQGKLYSGNYNPARLTHVDAENGKYNVLIDLGLTQFQQDRVHTITAGDNKIFIGTTPEKYNYGGYLAWYDLETNRIYVVAEAEKVFYAEAADQTKWYDAKTNELCDFDADNDGTNEHQGFKGIVDEQTVNCIVYHDGLIYGTTSTCGGTGTAERPDLSAVLFVYDVEKMELLATHDLRESIDDLLSPIYFVAGIAADPDVANNGKFWGVVSETLFSYTFDKENKKFSVKEELSFDKSTYDTSGSRQWFPRSILFKDGYMYIAFDNDGGMRKINMANPLDNERIMGDTPLWYVIAEDGNLYYSCKNTALNVLPLDVTAEDWAKAETVDALIAAFESPVTVDSDVAIKAARDAYNALSWAHRALVQNRTTLEEAESDLIEAKIDTIGEVTLEDAALIGQIRAEYDLLNEQQMSNVKNYDALLTAENTLADLQVAADKAAADAVIAKIEAIGTVTLESEEAIKEARAAYDALTAEQKALVDAAKLTAAEASLAELKAAAEKEAEDKAAADAVIAKIEAIGTVTLESEEAIKETRAAYDALTAEQKALVDAAKLTAAEASLAELKAAAEKEAEDKAAADAVIAKINAIGKVTADSGDAIAAARKAYNALTDDQKALVSNLDVLTDAEAAYEDAIKDPGSPDTGDTTPVVLLACVALISAMAIVAVPVIRKKV